MNLQNKLQQIDNDYPQFEWEEVLKTPVTVTASIVIPNYNGANSLPLVLKAIEKQTSSDNVLEIIIVDDNSSDNTLQVIEEFKVGSDLNIIVVKSDQRRYSGYSRNIAIEMAKGDIICSIDSDIIIPPEYLKYHFAIHQLYKCISLSLRTFIDKDAFLKLENPFPVQDFVNEFRIEKTIKSEWCKSEDQKVWANKKILLLEESYNFRKLGYGRNLFWTLPEVCLIGAGCFRREDYLKVGGSSINFSGWGYDDIAVAAKIISLERYVIPVLPASTYHINHPSRSGSNKYTEFEINKIKYQKMLQIEVNETYKSNIEELG